MLDIDEQLLRYGETLERDMVARAPHDTVTPSRYRHRAKRGVTAVAVAVLVTLVVATVFVLREDTENRSMVSTERPTMTPRAGVFSTPTNTVLLFSDGIDGVMAVDLDHREASRRVIEGARPGDPPYPLTLTVDHLIVGWGAIYAAPLRGGPSTKLVESERGFPIPAAEPGEVWTTTYGADPVTGGVQLQRARLDGTVTYASNDFVSEQYPWVIGVPGGLLVNTPAGVAVWDAERHTLGPVLGPGRATTAASNGRSVAWCEMQCQAVHIAPLAHVGLPTAPHLAPGVPQIALSSDGANLAVLRAAGDRSELILYHESSNYTSADVVARDLGPYGSLQWTTDGSQLFYSGRSPQDLATQVGRYSTQTMQWELETLPIGFFQGAIPIDASRASSFFAHKLVDRTDCRAAGGKVPKDPYGTCRFPFFTPDSPEECVATGPRTVKVPNGVGKSLDRASILMQRAGLHVVGTGMQEELGDPTDPGATVRAQEPRPGSRVPAGTCTGFRTKH